MKLLLTIRPYFWAAILFCWTPLAFAQPSINLSKGQSVSSEFTVNHGFRNAKSTRIVLPKGQWRVRYLGESKATTGQIGVQIWLEEVVSGRVTQVLRFRAFEPEGKSWLEGTQCDFLLSTPRGSSLSGGCFGLRKQGVLTLSANKIQQDVRAEYRREEITYDKQALWIFGFAERRDGIVAYFEYGIPYADPLIHQHDKFLQMVRANAVIDPNELQLANWFRAYGQLLVDSVVLGNSQTVLAPPLTSPYALVNPVVQAASASTEQFSNPGSNNAGMSTVERDRLAAELEAARKKQQELDERLATAQAQGSQRTEPLAGAPTTVRSAHALVIGNAAYPGSSRLLNPINDANGMSAKLRSLGFNVTTVTDANRSRLLQALSQFSRSAAQSDVSLLFFSGHGVQIDGTNYMLPTDIDDADALQATLQGVSLNTVIENFLPGKAKLVFLDACRDNPLKVASTKSVAKGLAPVSVAQGTLIAYATRDGQVALDGPGGRYSPFTQALLDHLGDPSDIGVVLRKVREKVMQATGGKQQPWEYGSLTGGELVLARVRQGQR